MICRVAADHMREYTDRYMGNPLAPWRSQLVMLATVMEAGPGGEDRFYSSKSFSTLCRETAADPNRANRRERT